MKPAIVALCFFSCQASGQDFTGKLPSGTLLKPPFLDLTPPPRPALDWRIPLRVEKTLLEIIPIPLVLRNRVGSIPTSKWISPMDPRAEYKALINRPRTGVRLLHFHGADPLFG